MGNVNCSIVGQAWGGQGSSIGYTTYKAAYAGFNLSDWYPYILKFTVPEFTGKSQALTFALSVSEFQRNGAASSSVDLRYALCNSDENFADYHKTTSPVPDVNQLTSGRVSLSGNVAELSIEIGAITGGTTYYLILWGDNTGSYRQDFCTLKASTNHTVMLDYSNGMVYIDGGSSVDPYLIHISNGVGWDQYIPYIDNGTTWDICS